MQKSKHYLFSEALVQRIHAHDIEANAFQEEFYRMKAGLAGEEKLKTTLADYAFKSDYTVFYNFECVNDRGFTHQIDALLITPHFIIIFEVKQISGTLYYKPSLHEFYRITDNDTRENFPNPFDQAFRHKLFIEHFLLQQNIKIPVLQLVVIANYRAKLDLSLQGLPIMHMSGLPNFLERSYEKYPTSSINIPLLRSKFEEIIQQLPARRTIESHRIKTGVLCRTCDYSSTMQYSRGVWQCKICATKMKDALYETLHHYRVLISPRISNKEFRAFVDIQSKFVASKLLSRLGLESYGEKKGRYYVIPEDIYYKF